MNHVRRVGWGSAVFFVFVAIVLGICWVRWPQPAAEGRIHARLNTRVDLPRGAAPSCDEIRAKGGDYSAVRLTVMGMDTGLRAVGCTDGDKPVASFMLHHTKPNDLSAQADEAVWGTILGDPLDTIGTGRELRYDLRWAPEGGAVQHLSQGRPLMMLQIFKWWSPLALLIVFYVWALLIYLGRYTALIRDAASPDTPLVQRTFSLAKAQMAWWFAIVFAAFVFLWLVTGEMPSISAQALLLLGISSATTLASAGIVAPGKTSTNGREGEFFVDLLSDQYGVAIHRFQMLVMTMALGLIFLFDVATTLTMPQFDPSLLALMGLSAATYVGLKIPEQRAAAGAPPA